MRKVLVLGDSGKLGRALVEAFEGDHEVHGRSHSGGLEAGNTSQISDLLDQLKPDIVLNAIALNGLNPCECDPARAIQLNTLLPRLLAECSRRQNFLLVHFSTDAVFDGLRSSGFYRESDRPSPVNLYGLSKLGGDYFIAAETEHHYIFRLSVLAGPPGRLPQFLEQMIVRARAGEALQVADDIICSPSYVRDIAQAVRWTVKAERPYGLYHLANSGAATLYELMVEILKGFQLDVPLTAVSSDRFHALARKPLRTPLISEKLEPLRDWREAIQDYCSQHILKEGRPL